MDKLAKKLKRELARSPGKAGLLGVLCLVAVYYYVPLLGRLAGSPRQASGETLPVSPPTPSGTELAKLGTSATAREENGAAASEINWREILALIEREPYMQPGELGSQRDNPFALLRPRETTTNEDSKSAPQNEETLASVPAPSILDPREAGLVLSSTMVHGDQRIAMINGRTYRENAKIVLRRQILDSPGQSGDGELVYRVERIQPLYVELENGGVRHRLDLNRKPFGGK